MKTKFLPVLVLASSIAHADPKPEAVPYVAVSVGGGYLSASAAMTSVTAFTFGVRAAAGVALTPRLVAYLRFSYDPSVTAPDVTTQGKTASADGVTITQLGVGPGVSYYWSPSDSLSAGLITSKLSTSHGDMGGSTNWGYGVVVGAAKEWSAGTGLRVGITSEVAFESMDDTSASGQSSSTTALSWLVGVIARH